MLLAIDVGNSQSVLGLFEQERVVRSWRLTTNREQTSDEASVWIGSLLTGAGFQLDQVRAMAVSSVVPSLTPALENSGKDLFGIRPLMIDHRCIPDLKILNHNPSTVGPDRLVNAVAARKRYGVPGIVVDLGTATTLDVIDENGSYAGGVIMPGLAISADALFQRGARLGRVGVSAPSRFVGRTTEESIQAGIFLGAVGAVDFLVRGIQNELGFSPESYVVATGGLAKELAGASQTIGSVDENLTLEGIRLVWTQNQ